MTLMNSTITDEVVDLIIQQAKVKYNRSKSRITGQTLMPSDGFDWWIVKTTESYLNDPTQFINTERNPNQ